MTVEQTKYLNLITNEPTRLAHWLGFPLLTDLHNSWIKGWLKDSTDSTTLAHRGSYKTTALSIFITLHLIVFPNRNIIFFRKTDADVIEIINQVKKMLKGEVCQHLVKKIYNVSLQILKENATEITTNLMTISRGTVQLLGMGVGGSLTGKHGDLIITDDIVNLKDRISQAERNHTKQIYYELQNIKNRGGKIINTGTVWHKEDAISIMPNVVKYNCHNTGLMTREQVEEIRAIVTPSLFSANYELEHIASEDALFTTNPNFTADVSLIHNGYTHIDASYGGSDKSALTLGKRVGEKIYILGKLRHRHIDDCLNEFLEIKDSYLCGSIDTENNADKGYLAKEIRRRGGKANTPYHESTNKYIKISTYLKRHWRDIVFLEDTDYEYINQILDYTEDAEHDDAPDSLASIIRKYFARNQRKSLIGDYYV